MIDNNIEFVPMFDRTLEWGMTDGNSPCYFYEEDSDRPCTVESIVHTLQQTQADLDPVEIKYFMLFNEAYISTVSAKWIEPTDMVEYFRKYFIPAAEETGLKIVSPTFNGKDPDHVEWMAEIFAACWLLKDDEEFPCDIEKMEVFSFHGYNC